MAELVDALDLKSSSPKRLYGFNSRLGYKRSSEQDGLLYVCQACSLSIGRKSERELQYLSLAKSKGVYREVKSAGN